MGFKDSKLFLFVSCQKWALLDLCFQRLPCAPHPSPPPLEFWQSSWRSHWMQWPLPCPRHVTFPLWPLLPFSSALHFFPPPSSSRVSRQTSLDKVTYWALLKKFKKKLPRNPTTNHQEISQSVTLQRNLSLYDWTASRADVPYLLLASCLLAHQPLPTMFTPLEWSVIVMAVFLSLLLLVQCVIQTLDQKENTRGFFQMLVVMTFILGLVFISLLNSPEHGIFGRIEFSQGRWITMVTKNPKLMKKHVTWAVGLVRFFFHSLLWPWESLSWRSFWNLCIEWHNSTLFPADLSIRFLASYFQLHSARWFYNAKLFLCLKNNFFGSRISPQRCQPRLVSRQRPVVLLNAIFLLLTILVVGAEQ